MMMMMTIIIKIINMIETSANRQTVPNNKPDIIIRDNEKKNMYVTRCCSLRRKKCDQQRSREYSRGCSGNAAHVERKNKCDRDNWNHLKLI